MGMTDDDPVAHVDVVGGEARSGSVGGAVDVRVEKDGEPAGSKAERRAAIPIDRRRHPADATGRRRPKDAPYAEARVGRQMNTTLRSTMLSYDGEDEFQALCP